MPPKLGILAGGGVLPARLIETCRAQGRDCFVVAFKGQTEPQAITDAPHEWVRLGAAGKALELLKKNDVEEIVMAGPIKRPSLAAMRPDSWALKLLAKAGAGSLGDNGLLSAIVNELENEGLRVIGVDDILRDFLAEAKIYGKIEPDKAALEDIEKGFDVAWILGQADVGQAAVVQQGLVLAVEAIEGTEKMVARIPDVAREGPGGVLVKAKKPNQEKRADLPTVGSETVKQAAEAGLRGIAVEAGGALIVDPDQTAALADRLGIFLIGYAKGSNPAK